MSDHWTVPGYTEVRQLGRGGAGTVVMATAESGVAAAIKYLSPVFLGDQEFRESFRTEARLLAELSSPHVVQLYEYVETVDGAAIVMQLVEGASLRATLVEHGATEPQAALAVLKGSLLGLGDAHRAGVVHRDYKPENVLITPEGRSLLADFGVAARSGGAADGTGTPAYMAPEQWAGGVASPRGDIYAATATFVECLSGNPPFVAGDLDSLRTLHESGEVPADLVPEPVRDLAFRGLAKDPAARPEDAAAFLADLERLAVEAYGEDWEERGRESLGRRVGLLALLLPAAGAAATGSAIASATLGRASTGGAVSSAPFGLGAVITSIGQRFSKIGRGGLVAGAAATALAVGVVAVLVSGGGHREVAPDRAGFPATPGREPAQAPAVPAGEVPPPVLPAVVPPAPTVPAAPAIGGRPAPPSAAIPKEDDVGGKSGDPTEHDPRRRRNDDDNKNDNHKDENHGKDDNRNGEGNGGGGDQTRGRQDGRGTSGGTTGNARGTTGGTTSSGGTPGGSTANSSGSTTPGGSPTGQSTGTEVTY